MAANSKADELQRQSKNGQAKHLQTYMICFVDLRRVFACGEKEKEKKQKDK